MVRAVVHLVADSTFFELSAVLAAFARPTSDLVKTTTPVLPATLSTAPLVI